MLVAVKPGVVVDPIITVGETAAERLPVRVDPGRDLVQGDGRPGRVDVYVNHETSTVPFPFDAATGVGFNDFTNAMLSKLTLLRAEARRRARGRVRDPVGGELPALLLELPGDGGARLRPRDRSSRTRRRPTSSSAPARRGPPPGAGRRAGGRRRRVRRRERRVQDDLRDGPAQPREQRRARGLRPPGRALGRRHVRRRRRRSSTCTRRQARAQCGTTRARSTRSSRTIAAINDYGDLTGSARRSRARSSRCRRRSRRATRRRSRTGRT